MLSSIARYWRELRDIIILGCNFCLLFSAYSTLQSYQTSVNGKSGFYSLAVLYVVFGVAALLAPAFVRAYPLKYRTVSCCLRLTSSRPVLVISACTYVLFIGISVWGNIVPLIIAAVIIGIGAAHLWTAQATYVVRCSTEQNLGRNNGVFYSLWMASSIVGFVLATIFLAIYNKPRIMFIFLAAVGGIGTATMLFLREPAGARTPVSFAFLLETVSLFQEPRMLLMGGIILYLGARGGLVWGAMPSRWPSKLIGYVNICFGVAEVIGGVTFGKLSDRIGRKPVLFIAYIVESCALALSGFATSDRLWACYISMLLFGFSDSMMNVVVNSVLPTLQPKKTQAAFGYKSCLSSAASSAMLFAGPYLPFDIMQLILVGLLVNGMICFFILDRFFARVEPAKVKEKVDEKKAVPMQEITPKSSIVYDSSPAPSPVPSPAPGSDVSLVHKSPILS